MALEPTSTITGCMSRGDKDMYVVTVPSDAGGTVVEVRLRGQNEMAPRLELLDGDRNRIEYESGSKGAEIMSWAHVAAGTSIYVRVDQIHGVDEGYTLTLSSGPVAEPGEPNDTWETATPLTLGTPTQGIMSAVANNKDQIVDWYRFEATESGTVEVTADMTGEAAPKVEVLNGDRKRVKYNSAGRGARARFDVPVEPGTYYIRVSTGHALKPAGGEQVPPHLVKPYSITVTPQ
ncbi:PPC domain-containing protein [Haliangium sp.]|uniref:PPC domain-containing protein n=1 Tax=Haliangium sp. TaxID=2663208 RepID=UPI003D0D9512